MESRKSNEGICIRTAEGLYTRELLEDILSGYDNRIIPLRDDDNPLPVKVGISLRQIIELDAKRQILTTNVWIKLQWEDARLGWDPAGHNDTLKVAVPHSQIWKPDMVLYDNTDIEYRAMLQDVSAAVFHNGTVRLTYPALFKTSCKLAIYYFPFDEQLCHMRLGSWTYDVNHLEMDVSETAGDITYYKYNSEWGLVNYTAVRHSEFHHDCCEEAFHDMEFIIKIRRRAIMHFFYLYFPNILINIIATFQFMLPCDSTEKVTLGITIILAMIVYLLLMADMLPLTMTVPIIVNYMATTLALVTVSLVTTILVLEIHHNGQHDNHSQLPQWARKYLLHGLAKILCMDRYITSDEEHEQLLHQVASHVTLAEEEEDEDVNSQAPSTPTMGPSPRLPTVGQTVTPPTITPAVVPPIISPSDKDMSPISFPFQNKIKPMGREGPRESVQSQNFLGLEAPTKDRAKSMVIKRSDLRKNKDLLLLKILKHCEDFSERAVEQDKEKELACEWQQLAMVLDRAFVYIYAAITVTLWIYVFSNRPIYKDPIIA